MQGRSGISAEFHQAARDGQRARHLAGSRHFWRFTHIQEHNIGAPDQPLRFIGANARHHRFRSGEHLLNGQGHGLVLPG